MHQESATYREQTLKIKGAILLSRYQSAENANAAMLNLYYGIGKYISDNTRSGKWGSDAIEAISRQLQGEIQGLHGFSASNMKNMRIFYEAWVSVIEPKSAVMTADLSDEENSLQIRQLATAEFDDAKFSAFCRVGFTHHREILRQCKTLDERWYYILRCADEFWSVAMLKNHLKDNDFAAYGRLPNNFSLTIPDEKTAAIAMRSFRDEYLLDYIDIKESDEYEERDVKNAIVDEVKKFVMTIV
jgi:hypothetical protein